MAAEMERRGPTAIPTTSSDSFSQPTGITQTRRFSEPVQSDSPRIFISYRRLDSADTVGRIYDKLVEHFGPDYVFKDVNSIPIGVDFPAYLEGVLAQCQLLIAVIGDKWLTIRDEMGVRRLDDPHDFVRIEIETAIRRNLPVFPILVQGAAMPSDKELPTTISTLTYKNAVAVRRDPDFHPDMDRLIKGIEERLHKT